jgi:flagellar hook protein FlgE
MLDSIHVGVTGLLGHQQGLRVIANNTANMNTPGYKGSRLGFADLFYASASGTGGNSVHMGHGLNTTGTFLNFAQGELRQTGGEFDLAMDGEGLFMLRNDQGQTRYTRAGTFQFNAEGVFVHRADDSKVLGLDAAGKTRDISLDGLRLSPGKPTTNARFTGNLSSTVPEQTVSVVKLFDGLGQEHTLSVKFTNTEATAAGSWKVELLEGASQLGSAEIVFVDGRPTAGTSKLTFTYAPAGRGAQQLVLDFASDVTSFASGSLSTLAMTSQDGYAAGNLTKVTFDSTGTLVASYANGQTVKGPRLALGRFTTPDAVEDLGGGMFAELGGLAWQQGVAAEGGFGALRSGMLEMSNVDLSREFTELVVMQRGYQAASQVISTANDMLQELFGMKHK